MHNVDAKLSEVIDQGAVYRSSTDRQALERLDLRGGGDVRFDVIEKADPYRGNGRRYCHLRALDQFDQALGIGLTAR